MFLYNITVKVNHKIEQEWIRWQKEIYIPGVMDTGLFYAHEFYLLLEQNDAEGKTFVTQFFTNSRDNYDWFIQQYAPVFYEDSLKKWGDGFIDFRTLLQSVK
jgi:Domain of unknown function (DUF4286)